MRTKKAQLYHTNPLTISKTIDLPSNLLQARKIADRPETTPTKNVLDVNLKPLNQTIPNKKRNNVTVIEEKKSSKKGVLYKRLTDIQGQTQELNNYSFSKLLSKMIVIEPTPPNSVKRSIDYDRSNYKAAQRYGCLRGKLIQMECDEHPSQKQRRSRYNSINQEASRTTKIFKKFYLPSSEKTDTNFFNAQNSTQRYIFINGKKTQCKRIHNFYTSQNFRNSYDKVFRKTHNSTNWSKDDQ